MGEKKPDLKTIESLTSSGKCEQALLLIEIGLKDKHCSETVRKHLLYQEGLNLQTKNELNAALESFLEALSINTTGSDQKALDAKIKGAMGITYYGLHEFETAHQTLEEAYAVLRETTEHRELGNVQVFLGWCCYKVGDFTRARHHFEDSIPSFRRVGDDISIAKVKSDLGCIHLLKSEWGIAVELFRDAIELQRSKKIYDQLPRLYLNLGASYLLLGNFKEALTFLKKSRRLVKRTGDDFVKIRINIIFGHLYQMKRSFEKAEYCFTEALNLSKELGGEPDVAIALLGLGELAFDKGNYEEAGTMYQDVVQILARIERRDEISSLLYSDLGYLDEKLGNLESAWQNMEKCLELSRAFGNKRQEALTCQLKGLILKDRGDREKALGEFIKCLDIMAALGEKYGEAKIRLEIGRLLSDGETNEGYLNEARSHFLKALQLYNEMDIQFYIVKTAVEAARVHAALGEDEKVTAILGYAQEHTSSSEEAESVRIQAADICSTLEESMIDQLVSEREDQFLLSAVSDLTVQVPRVPCNVGGLEKLFHYLMRHIKADRGFIARRDGVRGEYKVAASVGFQDMEGRKLLNLFKSVDRRIFSEKRPFISINTANDGRFNSREDSQLSGVNSLIIIPFGLQTDLEGFFYVDRKSIQSDFRFRFRDLKLMDTLSRYLSIFVTAMERDELRKDVRYLSSKLIRKSGFENIITQEPRMLEILEIITRIKDSTIPVLLNGETGTGKELVARAIHYTGSRNGQSFMAINCVSLPDKLLESELFGHRRGSFTGAISDRKGLFEVTNGGTFFLDEIADMGLENQGKLLRVLESGEIKRLGDNVVRKVDVRIISATNKDLLEEVRKGLFREDLYYRLNGINIEIPPLRERRADIPLLVFHFLEKYSADEEKHIRGITAEAMNFLSSYSWPGNVRELVNEVRRAITLAEDGEEIGTDLLSERIKNEVNTKGCAIENSETGKETTLREELISFEKKKILQALSASRGKISSAARQLGIPESTLRRKIKLLDLNNLSPRTTYDSDGNES